MPLVTLPYQFSYNTFLFGNGTPFQIIDIDGLASQPDLRVQDAPKGYNDGYLTGRDFFNGRTITFTIHIFAGDGNSAHENWLLLQKAIKPVQEFVGYQPIGNSLGNSWLQFKLAATDTTKVIFARPRSRKAKIDPEYTFGFIKAQMEFFAPDYRYWDWQQSGTSMTPQLANGRIYNRTYNLVYSQARTGNANATGTIANDAGTAATGFYAKFFGPMTNPQLTNLQTGAYLRLAVSLSASDVLVVDTVNNIVTLNGGNARNLLTSGSQFFTIRAGQVEQVYLTAQTSTGSVDIIYYVAYA